ncbi:Serine--tRNA synthetase-like protein Slimp [Sergentomyia squamirostris]
MLSRRVTVFFTSHMRKFSALYLTGDKAKEEYASVHPYLDLKAVLQDKQGLEQNMRQRKMQINIQEIYSQWKKFRDFQEKKVSLEKKRVEIVQVLKEAPNLNLEAAEKLKAEGKALREVLKTLKEDSYSFEDEFITNFLKLPNSLHQREQPKIISTYLERPTSGADGKSSNSYSYYCKGDLARFDFNFTIFCQKFLRSKGFEYISNPDFVRSVVVEAAGVPMSHLYQVIEEDGNKINQLYLAGGASMLSFLGFIAKLSVPATQLPIKLMANGKVYCSDTKRQGNAVQAFIATRNLQEAEEKFDELVQDLKEIYEKFNQHFRVIYVAPDHLGQSEMLRASIEMFSNQDYSEVASVSLHGDYLSKRLLFNYKEGKDNKFPNVVSSTVVNTSKLSPLVKNIKFS